jgi:hypothetical protein
MAEIGTSLEYTTAAPTRPRCSGGHVRKASAPVGSCCRAESIDPSLASPGAIISGAVVAWSLASSRR